MRMAARSYINTDFDIPVELTEDRDHAVKRETPQLRVSDAREVGMRNTRQLFGRARSELASVQHADDPGRKNGARLLKIGIGTAEVAEHIATAVYQFKIILAHRRASFSRLIRSLIRSTS